MDLKAEKIELVKMILNTEDKTLIGEIFNLFKKRELDFWETLPANVKAGIRKSQEQLRDGNSISYEDAMKRLNEI
jgi:hypothetical protein